MSYIWNISFSCVSLVRTRIRSKREFSKSTVKHQAHKDMFFLPGTKWLSWHLGNQKSVLWWRDIRLHQPERKSSQLSWAFFGVFLSQSEAWKIAVMSWGTFGSKNDEFLMSKSENFCLSKLAFYWLLWVCLGLGQPLHQGKLILGKNGSNTDNNLFFFIPP